MRTYFAPPERATQREISREIITTSNSPITSYLLDSVQGMLAILNDKRQIVAVNTQLLDTLDIDEPTEALGLRLGEVLKCVHVDTSPSGCGTAKACRSCGAAIAIVASLDTDEVSEQLCTLSAKRNNRPIDIVLLIKARTVLIESHRFVLLFLNDHTLEYQRSALEKTFFHDINNRLSMLTAATSLLVQKTPSELAKTVHEASVKVAREIAIQAYLSRDGMNIFKPLWEDVPIENIFSEIDTFFKNHPVSSNKRLDTTRCPMGLTFRTDTTILLRILFNMITNALEATPKKGTATMWAEKKDQKISFLVWNMGKIPCDIVPRIFQKNFSTKNEKGRGLGTYSMKLFGEKILGGTVGFTSSSTDGTIFKLTLPLDPQLPSNDKI